MLGAARRKFGAAALAMFVIVVGWSTVYATEGSGGDSLDGKLLVAHEYTGTDSNVMRMQVGLMTADGYVALDGDVTHDKAMKLANKKVRVRGRRVAAQQFDATQIAAAPGAQPAAAAPRPMRIAVVALDTTGPTDYLDQHFFTNPNFSQKAFIEKESDGQVQVTGRVFGPYATGLTSSCSLGELMNAGRQKAEADGYRNTNFDTMVIYAPGRSCGFAGVATIGMGGVFLNGYLYSDITLHELGHNLGVWHAGLLRCGSQWKPSCAVTEYGSPIDVMGAGTTQFSGIHKKMLGWVPPSNVATVSSGSATITLKSHDRPLSEGGTRIIEIPRGDGTKFSVERRYYGTEWNGAWLHLVSSRGGTDIQFFDTAPRTRTLGDGALITGESFTDPTKDITVKMLSNDEANHTSVLQVCFGTCGAPPPTSTTTSTSSTSSTTSTSSTSSTTTTTTTIPPNGNEVTVAMAQGRALITGTTGSDTIHITQVRDNLRSIDANGRPIIAGKGCKQESATVVTCRAARVFASLGDGNDSVIVAGRGRMQFDGGAGNDTFLGGPSADVFIGGLGNDAVDYRNRAAGSVDYEIGGGPHSGARGEQDDIRADIESVLMP